MLDNALLVGDGAWDNNVRSLRFRVRNKLDEGVPYHYVLLIQSISEELHAFYTDLELLRREDGLRVSGNVDGADGCFGVTHSSVHLLFPWWPTQMFLSPPRVRNRATCRSMNLRPR